MRRILLFLLLLALLPSADAAEKSGGRVWVIPVREDVMTPLKFVVRRGVKDAIENKADLLILDMDTNGGRVDVTQEIIAILGEFKGKTATFVNSKAFSAGAFIAFATQQIYMAEGSVIGAAAPIIMGPNGPAELSESIEAKMVSALKAQVRTVAEKNGHNVQVVEAMIDRSTEVKIGDKVLNEKGKILTLTNREAEQEYGEPAKKLLSAGTVGSIEEVAARMGFGDSAPVRVQPLGAERLATWLTALSPILLMIGVVGIYIEMKTPGFGLPGVVGIVAFALYFLGSYIAGLAGLEWIAIFILGLALFMVELFIFPGTIAIGLAGAVLMIAALVMAMVDLYPGPFQAPSMAQLQRPLLNVFIAFFGSAIAIAMLSQVLPRTPIFRRLVSQTASGVHSTEAHVQEQESFLGLEGAAVSPLRPGGKAQFGKAVHDVVTQGMHLPKGARVRVIGRSGPELVVEEISA
ncbi:MAG TPA: NfeD family protein [Methylomirabilota bacterium]|nr:NfeD family protein [Methylomirabilota bacterium]